MASNLAPPSSTIKPAAFLLLSLLPSAQAAVGQTSAACAWINEATASGLLGGNADVVVSEASGDQPAACTFTEHGPGITRTLRISVETVADAHTKVEILKKVCGPDAAPLRAIGNEATVCMDRADGGPGERVIGRVRDQVFTITLTSTQQGDAFLTHAMLRAKINAASEQVSGNLF